MKKLALALLCLAAAPAWAQSGRTYDEIATDLYLRANDAGRLHELVEEAARSPQAYLVAVWQPGELLTIGQKTRPVARIRYNVAHSLLEMQDSIGNFRVFPPGSLRGFTLGQGQHARRFQTRACRGTNASREFVEVLTAGDQGPVTVALYHRFVDQKAEIHPVLRVETQKAQRVVVQQVLAGPDAAGPLQALTLTKRTVLKLFGARAREVEAYAATRHFSYEQLQDVVWMADFYNALK